MTYASAEYEYLYGFETRYSEEHVQEIRDMYQSEIDSLTGELMDAYDRIDELQCEVDELNKVIREFRYDY